MSVGGGETVAVQKLARAWKGPAEIGVYQSGVVFVRGEGPAERPVRLIVGTRLLSAAIRDELWHALVCVEGVVPAGTAQDALGCVSVRCAEPDVMAGGEVSWKVTEELEIACNDRHVRVGMSKGEKVDDDGVRVVEREFDLTLGEAWALACALLATDAWRSRVDQRARQAGRQLRREAQLRVLAARALAGEWGALRAPLLTARLVAQLAAQLARVEQRWEECLQAAAACARRPMDDALRGGPAQRAATLTQLAARREELAAALADAVQEVGALAGAGRDYASEQRRESGK